MPNHTATSIEETPESLRIVMPVPRAGCVAVFLGVWLTGWLFGEVSAIGALFQMGSLLNPGALFLVVWLTGWTAGGAVAAGVLAMTLGGLEIVTFTDAEVDRRAEAFGRGLNWRFEMADVTNLRKTADTNGAKSFISFDYRGKTVRFGTGLNETEAERAVQAAWSRFPRLMPRVERVRRDEAAREAAEAAADQTSSGPSPSDPATAEPDASPPPAEPPTGVDWA